VATVAAQIRRLPTQLGGWSRRTVVSAATPKRNPKSEITKAPTNGGAFMVSEIPLQAECEAPRFPGAAPNPGDRPGKEDEMAAHAATKATVHRVLHGRHGGNDDVHRVLDENDDVRLVLGVDTVAQMLPADLASLIAAVIAAIAEMKPAVKAILAADSRKAGVPAWLVQLLTKASPAYTSTAFHLTNEQRQRIDRGEATLASYHNAKKTATKLDREIEDFVARKARKRPEHALAVLERMLDRMTAPPAK
jgi:hypothetical protein